MNRRQKSYAAELGNSFVSVAEHRAAGEISLEVKGRDGRFRVLHWFSAGERPHAEQQARLLARNFAHEYRLRGPRMEVLLALPRRKPNSAVARRYERREVYDIGRDEWGEETRQRRIEEVDTPAHVTDDHWTDPAVIEARELAEELRWEHHTLLGSGNFGVAYRARGTPPRVAKMPAAHNLHGQPWGRDAQRHNILHEAGVANELTALGYSVVPRGVYTEWGGGTPTFVREYGEPVTMLTPAEYGDLEAQLVSIERDQRWRVEDDLQLYRRPDGSVFVADVGVWQAPSGHTKTWSSLDSSLDHKLGDVQQRFLPGLDVREPGKHPPHKGYEYTLRVPVPTLARLADYADSIVSHTQAGRYEGKRGAAHLRIDAREARELLSSFLHRDELGIPTPANVRAAVPIAEHILQMAAAAVPDTDRM